MNQSSHSAGVCKFWYYDDVTKCGRVEYLNFYTPLVLLCFFGSFTGYKTAVHVYRRRYLREHKPNFADELAATSNADENKPLLSDASGAIYTNPDAVPKEHNLKEEHFSIENLRLADPDGKPHGLVEVVKRNFVEKARVVVEFLLVLAQLAIHVFVLINLSNEKDEFPTKVSIVNVLLWSWLLFVVILRLLNINEQIKWIKYYPGNLWTVSFVSYMFLFASRVLPFRSVFIGHITDDILKKYVLSQFYIDLALFMLLFTAKIGNDHAVLYRTSPETVPSPEPVTSIMSFISWSWIDKFVWEAHQHSVKLKDIWGLMLQDYSIFVLKKFKVFSKKTKGNFSYKLIRFFSKYLLLQGFWACIDSVINFIPTLLLKRILEYVDDQSTAPANLAWFYVCAMFVCRILVAICQAQALFFGRRVCIRMKAIIISEIYTKALRRKTSPNNSKSSTDDVDPQVLNQQKDVDADEESSTANLGAIINLMAVDAFKVSEICAYLHSFVEALVMTIVALTLLYKLLGWSAIIGALLIVAILPLNFRLATLIGKLQKETLSFTDKRIQKLNETFQAIRIIKFFSWEENFEKDIQSIRDQELKMLVKRSVAWALTAFVWFITPTIVTSVSFAFYIYVQGEVLTTPVAFTALSLFTLLRNPLDMLSDMLSYVIQSKVSLDRVQEFLEEEETEKYEQITVHRNKIGFENATFSWDRKNPDFKLKNMNIDFKLGKLNVVIGPTGSGKTSLLMGLLGEMDLLEGKVYAPCLDPREDMVIENDGMTNSIAYCSQAAWLLNDTVKNNILFSSPFNEGRYNAVIEACGLKRDFEILSAGDQTEIGEKGITLSGGQKQRVSLARALYSSSRHLLLDDCLSAVDSHTALWIYENCISGPLMEGRTCILVSHNVALTLKNAEWVVFMENGRVKDQGEPLELYNKGLLGEDELVKTSVLSRGNSSTSLVGKSSKSGINLSKLSAKIEKSSVPSKKPLTEEERVKMGKLIEEETKSEGVVSIEVYKWFAKLFGGWKMVIFLASIFIVAQCVYIFQSWWVRAWASHNTYDATRKFIARILPEGTVNGLLPLVGLENQLSVSPVIEETVKPAVKKSKTHSTIYYLLFYFFIGVAQAVIASSKTIINFMAGLNASRKIFNLILKKVLYAKLRFFDSTPIGRIMNRFSRDIEAVDQELTPFVEGAFVSLVQCLSTVILIAYITPDFFFVAIFIGIFYYLVGYFYMAGSRELKRYESISRSPIHQHFSETLVGITTIRAFGDERRFMQENLTKIDENNKPFFYLWVANRWLAFRIDMIGACVIFAAGIFVLLNIKSLDSGLAGISLTYAISFTEGALWLVRLYSNVEMTMNSVERLKEYMEVEQEPHYQSTHNPPPEWPSQGKIEVNDLSLRYAPSLPKVIKNVTFTVDPNCKVGIVGRTGAGKSTIITALFRFLDPESGYIKIDNVDITSVELKRLRQSITIIPQDPTLFTGTVKSNLDPYDEYSDKQIFEALKRVNLVTQEELDHAANPSPDNASAVSENVNKFLFLENEISEGGSNLSQGQRQLVCLARSLLRSPKVMLLDEATASIDYQSDARIQQTIRSEFSDSTILTIAHRLRSIIDYDKILVMDAGEVKEYDHPYSLLLNKNSIFYSMCEDSGELEVLIQLAKESFVKKLNSK
ncbi:bile acid-transporting ATPase YBT1 [Lachancea thermotolerans CBS 6340]|uniref:KLTH0H16038p n=1 Tax=Lachancea thermotolerans (strain ATCC 56472 / CBS 6340 / NRRL Y-8284) TaxID=559295 RepID=C5E3S9_LACTC|nr:KLTH0H16038p [Lachancea thermotolerans CBS 6340]CAR30690.1 KLTH0H16038p [Lachancea thermotolerans CBS 6340]